MSSPALCSPPKRALAKTWSSTRYSASRSEIGLWASHWQLRKSRRKKQLLLLSFCKNVSSLELYIYISTSSRRWWNIPERRQGAKAQPRRLGNYSVSLGRKLIFPLASGLCTRGPSVNFLPIPAPLFQWSPRPAPWTYPCALRGTGGTVRNLSWRKSPRSCSATTKPQSHIFSFVLLWWPKLVSKRPFSSCLRTPFFSLLAVLGLQNTTLSPGKTFLNTTFHLLHFSFIILFILLLKANVKPREKESLYSVGWKYCLVLSYVQIWKGSKAVSVHHQVGN